MTTRSDITDYVVNPALDSSDLKVDTANLDAIVDDILDAAPLDTWRLAGTDYQSTALNEEAFWAIVWKHVAA